MLLNAVATLDVPDHQREQRESFPTARPPDSSESPGNPVYSRCSSARPFFFVFASPTLPLQPSPKLPFRVATVAFRRHALVLLVVGRPIVPILRISSTVTLPSTPIRTFPRRGSLYRKLDPRRPVRPPRGSGRRRAPPPRTLSIRQLGQLGPKPIAGGGQDFASFSSRSVAR